MGINLVTFAGSTVTPQDDALIYETALLSSGMIYGGVVTIKSANTLHVGAGHGALCGRKFTIEETDIPIALTASGSLAGRLYIHMDLADADEPISLLNETAASLTPVIQDADVNIINGVYEINLCTFTVDTASISNLVDTRRFITPPSADMGDLADLETTDKSNLVAAINEIKEGSGKTLYYTSVACAATTGNFTTVNDAKITANHVIAECVFANPSAITTDVTWTTTNGSVTLNGTCASATTCTLVLVEKNN